VDISCLKLGQPSQKRVLDECYANHEQMESFRRIPPYLSDLPEKAAFHPRPYRRLRRLGVVDNDSQIPLLRGHMLKVSFFALLLAASAMAASGVLAAEVNLYTARHYEGDQKLYDAFTKATGIAVNKKEGKPEELLQLIVSQGVASPADLLLTVDAGNLWRAETSGVLSPVNSAILESRIPAQFRDPANRWFGVAYRARILVVARARALELKLSTYDDLADPRLKGLVCMRPSSNVYNLSLLSARIAARGAPDAEKWAKGVVANFARPPQGNDTDQIKSVASGECAVSLINHYYLARLQTGKDEADKAAAAKVLPVFPDQLSKGAHVNISGGGVLTSAPNRANAIKFLEFLASDEAQSYFAEGNFEYPVVKGVEPPPALEALGSFKADALNVGALGQHQPEAQRIFDRAGWR
jgi:iron(III) transport system substrate-binding protein